jgi:hypothetical protein
MEPSSPRSASDRRFTSPTQGWSSLAAAVLIGDIARPRRLAGFADRPNLLVAISHRDYLSSASVSLQISSGAIFR